MKQKQIEVNIILNLRSYGNLKEIKFIYRARRLHVFVPSTHTNAEMLKKDERFGRICYTLTDKIFGTILWGRVVIQSGAKVTLHGLLVKHRASSNFSPFCIKKKQHTSRSVNEELSSTNNKPCTCVIGTIYCDLLDHFPGVYVCYTNQWDLYFEIALSLKPNVSVSKCSLIHFYTFSVLVLYASLVSIVCAHHLRYIIMEQRLFWTISHYPFCLSLYSCVFHELQTVFWFVNGQNNINIHVTSVWLYWGHWLQIKATSNLMFLILTTNIYRFLCIGIYHPTLYSMTYFLKKDSKFSSGTLVVLYEFRHKWIPTAI